MLSQDPLGLNPPTRRGARLDVGDERPLFMADLPGDVDRDEILGHLLAKDPEQPRDEPEIAANIHAQLQHMGLSTWSISVHRRIRDAIGRLRPKTVLEVGASIGHRTAWLLDQFERAGERPTTLTLVEQGGKFGVILQRLLQRYDAMPWAKVVVGEPGQLAAEHQAWQLAATTNIELSQTPFERSYDVIIVDAPSPQRAGLIASYLPLLNPNGVMFTVEPDMPSGDIDENDEHGMALVNGFNRWIEVIGDSKNTHHLAFMPLFGGTVVAWLPRHS